MKKKSWILIIIILFCIGLSILLLNIVKRINIDKLIIKEDIKNVKCDQDLENIKEIGNYEIKIIVDNNEYISKLIIYDNVIDKIELKEVTMSIDEELPSIKDFIVNDIDLQDRALVTYYSDVVFKQHVNVKKDSIQPYEFSYAEFLNGITIQSRILPRGALTGASMSGIVDLTSVEILGSDNLNFQSVADCTVKLSKNLKEIDASTFSVSMANKPMIEYDGTIKEFNELIENNISRWTKRIDKSLFILTVKALGIECNDGT